MANSITDIHDFVAAVSLDTIVIHEERARLIQWSEEELEAQELPTNSSSMAIGTQPARFRYRFRTRHTDEFAEYIADVEAIYSTEEETELDAAVSADFAGRVAFMAAYPFIRASIYNSAARLGQSIPVLGIVRQGEFESGNEMTLEETRAEFLDTRSEAATAK